MPDVLQSFTWNFFAQAIMAAVADLIVCTRLCRHLLKNRTGHKLYVPFAKSVLISMLIRKRGLRRGDSVIVKMVRYLLPSCAVIM